MQQLQARYRHAPRAPHLATPAWLCSQALAQVFDLQNKVVAASASLEQPMAWLLPHAGGGCIDIGAAPLSAAPAEAVVLLRCAALRRRRARRLPSVVSSGHLAAVSAKRGHSTFCSTHS